jgi:hypothetical protein
MVDHILAEHKTDQKNIVIEIDWIRIWH